MKLNILNLENFNYSIKAKKLLKKVGNYEDNLSKIKKNRINVLICRFKTKLDKKYLSKFIKLKFILTNTTGLNHIDLKYCKKNKIKIFSLKNQTKFLRSIRSTAELYLALILNISRNIPAAINDVRNGNWHRDSFIGNNLFKKKIGILGLGRNGSILASYCKKMGMNVCYYDNNVQNKLYKKFKNLENFLKNLDYIAICINYSADNHKIINKKFLNLLPKYNYFINCSRGEVVCERSLLAHLKGNKIRGAAIDVMHNEQYLNKSNPLIKYSKKNNNLIITPHLGGATIESWHATEEFIANFFIKYVKKKKIF